MLSKEWQSDKLCFTEFGSSEAGLAKSLFSANHSLVNRDPTFREWPESEYERLIRISSVQKTPTEKEAFYLRKIATKNNECIGYVQMEINAPETETLWIPMLCLVPKHHRCGYGTEAINSVIDTVCAYTQINRIGLNVYVENVSAFKFWYSLGFDKIRSFEKRSECGREFNCLVLYRDQ